MAITHDELGGVVEVANRFHSVGKEHNLCIDMLAIDFLARFDTCNCYRCISNPAAQTNLHLIPVTDSWQDNVVPCSNTEDKI